MCGAPIYWPPRNGSETNKPLDPTQPRHVDLDTGEQTVHGYDRYGYMVRGTAVPDPDSGERPPAAGARRIVKCYPVHACDPVARATHGAPDCPHHGAADPRVPD